MKLRLRWVLSCEKRAGRSETEDWRKEFAVPEGVGTTKIRATCRSARGTFDASWRRVEKATMALGRVQNFASHLAWQWHTAMEGAHEVSLLGSSLWGRLPVRNGTSATGSQASATAAIDLEASSRALLRRHEPDEGPPRQSQRLRHVLSERGRRESPVGRCAVATAKLPHRPAARSPPRTKHASILRGILT